MENSRFLACLEADYRRIREVVPGHLAAPVPSCPDWTMADLTRHVGEVYLHKVECMREGHAPKTDWPPAGLGNEEPVALLDRSYADLVAELTTRDPAAPGGTWYAPDPTVGFWIRRMAQESVIHRIDAELGAGAPIAPIPDDLAIDGIDELLKVFVAYSFSRVARGLHRGPKELPRPHLQDPDRRDQREPKHGLASQDRRRPPDGRRRPGRKTPRHHHTRRHDQRLPSRPPPLGLEP
jgi:uncharacterized protein (TIGR03083 family)